MLNWLRALSPASHRAAAMGRLRRNDWPARAGVFAGMRSGMSTADDPADDDLSACRQARGPVSFQEKGYYEHSLRQPRRPLTGVINSEAVGY